MTLAYSEHYTVRDYQKWDGDWELIGGEPYAMSPSPGISHQRLEKRVLIQFDNNLNACSTNCEVLSEVDWLVSDDTVVRPDILIACSVSGEKLTQTPEVIVEIISPSTARRDELLKFELYQKEGVKFYILIYPDPKKAKVYRLIEGQYIKEADFSQEIFEFEIQACQLSLDFDQIW